jgi:hypothetical protein
VSFLGRHRDGEERRGQGSLSRLPAYSSLTMDLQGARDFLVRLFILFTRAYGRTRILQVEACCVVPCGVRFGGTRARV